MKFRFLSAAAILLVLGAAPAHAWREGDHDPAFDAGSTFKVPFAPYVSGSLRPTAIGLSHSALDGTYLAAVSYQDAPSSTFSAVLYRVLPDGQADTTFNSTGVKRVIDSSVAIQAMATDASNDDIVLAGGNQSQSSSEIVVCRYAANGVPDNNLVGHNGVGCIDYPVSTFGAQANVLNVHAVAVQAWDHRIVIAGDVQIVNGSTSRVEMFVLRLFEPGSIDTGFASPAGYRLIDLASAGGTSSSARALAFDATHRILIAGVTSNATSDFAAARISPNGSIDTSCGGGASPCTIGIDFQGLGTRTDQATSITTDAAGHIYVAGLVENGASAANPHLYATGLARLTPNFALDANFGGDGLVFGFVENNADNDESDTPPSVAIDDHARPFVACGNEAHVVARRFTTFGVPDATYGNGSNPYTGNVSVTAAPNGGTGEFPYGPARVLFDHDKPVVAAVTGIAGNPSGVELSIARLLGDDTIFGSDFDP
ncbi:MAG TPA: hypothetical protein VF132_13135 [Rudaea sp.]